MSVSEPATFSIIAASPLTHRASPCRISTAARWISPPGASHGHTPETYLRNVLEPVSIDAANFDSVGINYLLHCLPGTIAAKTVALDHLKALMNPNAVLFGSTLLQGGVSRNWLARPLMAFYNRKGIFSNRHDDLDGLKQALKQRFHDVSVEIVGCAALFSGRI